MRIWLVPPREMCKQHLLGEHRELHALVGSIEADNLGSLRAHAEKGQIATSIIQKRHDLIVEEMLERGYNHDSPLDYDDELDLGDVPELAGEEELYGRCDACETRQVEREGVGRSFAGP